MSNKFFYLPPNTDCNVYELLINVKVVQKWVAARVLQGGIHRVVNNDPNGSDKYWSVNFEDNIMMEIQRHSACDPNKNFILQCKLGELMMEDQSGFFRRQQHHDPKPLSQFPEKYEHFLKRFIVYTWGFIRDNNTYCPYRIPYVSWKLDLSRQNIVKAYLEDEEISNQQQLKTTNLIQQLQNELKDLSDRMSIMFAQSVRVSNVGK